MFWRAGAASTTIVLSPGLRVTCTPTWLPCLPNCGIRVISPVHAFSREGTAPGALAVRHAAWLTGAIFRFSVTGVRTRGKAIFTEDYETF